MDIQQPKPAIKNNTKILIRELEKGVIQIPQFQRDFVWSLEKTTGLLDSIFKRLSDWKHLFLWKNW